MEVELLEQIGKNTTHKTSFQIILSNDSLILIQDLIQNLSWIKIKYTRLLL